MPVNQAQKSMTLHRTTGIVSLAIDQSRENKRTIYSCGTDDSIGMWKMDDDGQLQFEIQNCANNCHGVLSVFGDNFYVGETSEDNITGNQKQVVVRYIKDEFMPSPPILTFTWEVTALALSRDGRYLVAGSSDFRVKFIDLEEREQGFYAFECGGHIVNLSIDPKCTFFAVSSSDGAVQIRTLMRASENFKKPIAEFKACSKFAQITNETSRMQISWLSSGDRAFIPSIGKVMVVNCSNWIQEKEISASGNTKHETFSLTAVSEDDEFLAACTIQGTLTIWKINGYQPHKTISVFDHGDFVTSMIFNPIGDGSIVTAYSEGCLGLVKDATSAGLNRRIKEESPQPHHIKSRISSSMSENFPADDPVTFDDDEVDLGRIKSQYGFDEEGIFNPSRALSHPSNGQVNQTGPSVGNYPVGMMAGTMTKSEPCTTIKKMRSRKPFQAGSTPMHQGQCYLMWNMYGVIRSYRTQDDANIEVAFHDTNVHSEINIDNTASDYSLGDLNNNLVALASHGSSKRESELMVHFISAWDVDSRQWNVKMPEGESIECLSLGSEFVAVLTDRRFLRIFSASGTQRSIVSTAGSIVTLSASENSLVLVRATGGVVITEDEEYEHQVAADVYTVNPLSSTRSISQRKTLPIALSEASQLKWICFSNAGSLVSMDSECVVRLHSVDNFWQPIFMGPNVLKDAECDYVWPIAVMERPNAMFRYVYCKGNKFPVVSKNLVPLTVSWELPMANAEADRSKLESELITNELVQSTLRSLGSDFSSSLSTEIAHLGQDNLKNLIKLFAIACKSGRECRAAELANLTSDSNGLQMLCTYAAKSQRPNLSAKVASIGRNRIADGSTICANAPLDSSFSLTQHSLASSSAAVYSTGEIQLAPSNKLSVKRKALQAKKSVGSISATERNNVAGQTISNDGNGSEHGIDHFPRPISSSATNQQRNESMVSDESFNVTMFAPESPAVNLPAAAIAAKNPFKRTIDETRSDSNIYSSGMDFFDQLSGKRAKLPESSSKKPRNSHESKEKANKKQSKLAFSNASGSAALDSEPATNDLPLRDTNSSVELSKQKTTGFDLWRDENEFSLLESYDGPNEEFSTFLIRQFRMLTSEEKKKWNDAAKLA